MMQDMDLRVFQNVLSQPPKKLALLGAGVGLTALTLFGAIQLTIASKSDSSDPMQASLMTPPPLLEASQDATHNTPNRSTNGLPQGHSNSDINSKNFTPSALSASAELTTTDITLTVSRGDTLGKMLNKQGVSRQEAYRALQALKDVFDPRRLVPGQELKLTLIDGPKAEDGAETKSLAKLVITPEPGQRSIVTRQDAETFVGSEETDPITVETAGYRGSIDSSLFAAGDKAGMTPRVIQRLIRLFSYDVDFQRDIRVGDAFEVMVDQHHLPDGTLVDESDIDFASITLSGTKLNLYRYEDSKGHVDYYNEKGQSARKALLRTPIDGARISSGYGRRKHPILGYTKMHKGIDFAAPRGTPVYAAGDGVIKKAKWWGGYGNYVRVRHNSTYSTAYGHLKRFAKGIRPGKRVKQGQIIAYSGNTGRSTGPHLHYEVLRNNRHVNPFKVKMPSGRKLKGKELARFTEQRKIMDRNFAAISGKHKVASN